MHAARAGWSPSEVERAVSTKGRPLPRVDFVAEAEHCAPCGEGTVVQKSRTRVVVTLEGGVLQAREVLKKCARGESCPVNRSQALRRIVKRCQRYGYDLIVHVALARYLRGLQREEIQAELRSERGIEVSTGTVTNLCDRFLVYLESLHVQRAPALRAAMEGGYPLHLDGTNDRGKGGTLVCMDGWRRWVLRAARIPSENTDSILPVVDKTVELFGDPVGTMRDLSDAMAKAVEPLRECGAVDLVCDYHFLAAVGNKLLDALYSRLRGALRVTGSRKALRELLGELRRYRRSSSYKGRFGVGKVRDNLLALVLWLLEGEGKKEPTFPFGLPLLSLVHRCRQVHERAGCWVPPPRTEPERRALRHLISLVAKMEKRLGASNTVQRLEQGWAAFSDLRDVLRHTDGELLRTDVPARQQSLPALELSRLKAIQDDLKQHEAELELSAPTVGKKVSNPSPQAVILSYLKTYWSKLVGHPVRYDETGGVIAVMERTNNVAEHFFGLNNRRLRRRVGRKHLGHDLDQQPAQAALVLNLLRPDYVRVLCGSLETLPEAFAQLDATPHTPAKLDRTTRDSHLLKLIKKLLRPDQDNSSPATPTAAPVPSRPQSGVSATVS